MSHPSNLSIRAGRVPAAPVLGALLLAVPLAGQDPDSVPRYEIPPLTVEVSRAPLAGDRAAFSVAALQGEELRLGRSGAFLSDALVGLPGLHLQNRYNPAVGERILVRGFGARAQFGVRGMKVVVDGVPATLPDGQTTLDHLDLPSLQRVEVLRGPGSSLWGNGAGGVLLLSTRRPDPGVDRFSARSVGGGHGLLETSARAELGHAGGASTLISATRVGWDGFRTDPVNGGVYGASTRWTGNARHFREAGDGELAVTFAAVDLDAENPGSLPADSLGDADRSAWGFNIAQGTGKTVRQAQLGISWRQDDDGARREASAWGLLRDVRNPIPSAVIGLDRQAAGLRLSGGGELAPDIQWQVGTEVEVQKDDRTNHENEGGDEGTLTLDQDETVRGAGVYGLLSAEVGRLALQGSLRYDRVTFEADDLLLGDGTDDSGSRSMDAWSPALGALVALGTEADVFVSAASFLETPTTTELANRPERAGGFNPDLEPTTGWTLEGGVRLRVLDRVGLEVVAFRTELDAELVPFMVSDQSGRTFFRNAGRSLHEGFEAAVRASLPGGFRTRMAYTRVDARFETASGDAEPGDRVPGRAPGRFEGTLDLVRGSVFAGLDVQWTAAVPVDDADTVEAPAHTLLDLRVGGRDLPLGALRVEPWLAVHNLLDENYVASVVPNAFGDRFFEPGPPRSLRVGLSVTR